jgi:hypothetical protein
MPRLVRGSFFCPKAFFETSYEHGGNKMPNNKTLPKYVVAIVHNPHKNKRTDPDAWVGKLMSAGTDLDGAPIFSGRGGWKFFFVGKNHDGDSVWRAADGSQLVCKGTDFTYGILTPADEWLKQKDAQLLKRYEL